LPEVGGTLRSTANRCVPDNDAQIAIIERSAVLDPARERLLAAA
jgi:hypothetical protein